MSSRAPPPACSRRAGGVSAACSPLEPRAGLPSVPMSKIVYFLGHGFSPEAAPKYPKRKTGECPPGRLLLPGGLGKTLSRLGYGASGSYPLGCAWVTAHPEVIHLAVL